MLDPSLKITVSPRDRRTGISRGPEVALIAAAVKGRGGEKTKYQLAG
jgi:hypothetical protein